MTRLTHNFPVEIKAADIDFMGHVNNAVYLKWVTDAVIAHWRKIASPEAVAAHVWVALKHEITYRKPAFLNDEVTATTELEQVKRESAFYETVIRRGEEVGTCEIALVLPGRRNAASDEDRRRHRAAFHGLVRTGGRHLSLTPSALPYVGWLRMGPAP